jgi:signal transduction histidine kinase
VPEEFQDRRSEDPAAWCSAAPIDGEVEVQPAPSTPAAKSPSLDLRTHTRKRAQIVTDKVRAPRISPASSSRSHLRDRANRATSLPRSSTARSSAVLRELIMHLRRNRARLREQWLQRILDGQYLTAMSADEIGAETTSMYDNYLEVLATGDIETLEGYARDLSERIIPRGVETREVVGIVLLLRDVLARELFSKYGGDIATLTRVLDAYEPAANRIATTVSAGFVQERERTIRRQQKALRELSARRLAEQALRALNQRLEEEARRIAHALHDEAGQLLVSVYLALDTLIAQLPPDARERLTEIRALLEQVEAQLRRLSHELRPTILDDLGLKPAIEFLADGISKRTGRSVVVIASISGRLPSLVEIALYRVVQEALTNVIKHAQATQTIVHLVHHPEALVCSIADNGRGFDARARPAYIRSEGLGLIGMRERAASLGGKFSIESSPGRGTTLKIVVPLKGVACHSGYSSPTTT